MEVLIVLVVWGVSLLIAYFIFKAAVENGVLEALRLFYAAYPPRLLDQKAHNVPKDEAGNCQTGPPMNTIGKREQYPPAHGIGASATMLGQAMTACILTASAGL